MYNGVNWLVEFEGYLKVENSQDCTLFLSLIISRVGFFSDF